MSEINVAAFMQYVQEQGVAIEEREVPGIRRFVLSQAGREAYLDVDKLLWPDVTQEWLQGEADRIMQNWK